MVPLVREKVPALQRPRAQVLVPAPAMVRQGASAEATPRLLSPPRRHSRHSTVGAVVTSLNLLAWGLRSAREPMGEFLFGYAMQCNDSIARCYRQVHYACLPAAWFALFAPPVPLGSSLRVFDLPGPPPRQRPPAASTLALFSLPQSLFSLPRYLLLVPSER